MKTTTLILAVLCLALTVRAHQSPPSSSVLFLKISLTEAKKKAAELRKPLLVNFSASWCMPCQWMDSNTFSDPHLASYLNAEYLAVKIDVDEVQGYTEKEANKVVFLPTILFIAANGTVVSRLEEAVEASKLMELAQQLNVPENRMPGRLSGAPGSSASTEHLNRPALGPSNLVISGVAPRMEQGGSTMPPPLPPSNPALRQVAIQVGLFSNYENVVRQVDALEKKLNQRVNIFRSTDDRGNTIYRVAIGPFSSPAAAQPYLELLKKQGLEGVVKDWQSL